MSVEYSVPSEDGIPENTALTRAEVLQQFVKNHCPVAGGRSTVFSPWVHLALVFHDNGLWSFNGNGAICSQEQALTLEPDALLARVMRKM